MSIKAQVHLLYLAKEYEQESQELSVLRKSLQIWSKEKQKPEEIILEQSNNRDHLSVHGPIKNTSRCMLKENIEGLELLEDSNLGKTILNMAHFWEKSSIRKCKLKLI